eukprot:3331972-Amphidinium_carterae.1
MRIAVIDIYKCYPTRTRCRGAASFPSDFNCGVGLSVIPHAARHHLLQNPARCALNPAMLKERGCNMDMRDDDTQKNSFLWMTPLSDHPGL